jgi:excisionase family DNA binding protein
VAAVIGGFSALKSTSGSQHGKSNRLQARQKSLTEADAVNARPDRSASPGALLLRLYSKGELWENQRIRCLKMKRISAPAKPAPARADEIMTVPTLALYLHCHTGTVYRLLKQRKIPAFRVGSDWRFSRSAIDDWIGHQEISFPSAGRGSKPKVR